MTFRQHQKFLSSLACRFPLSRSEGDPTYKKYYYSCYPIISNSKFFGQYFYNTPLRGFILQSFQFSISKSHDFHNFKKLAQRHEIFKKGRAAAQKRCFPFECFLSSNSLKIQNILMPFRPTNQIYRSSYFIYSLTCILNKKLYQTMKNTQLKRNRSAGGCSASFFCKQAFIYKAYDLKWNYKFNITIQNFITLTNERQISTLVKRERFIRNSLKGILLVNFPEKEKNFLIKNLAAENKIALITQSASLLLKDSRNMDDLLGVDDPIQILFDKVKTCIPCICFINNLDRIGKQRHEQEHKSLNWLNYSISLLIDQNVTHDRVSKMANQTEKFDLATTNFSNKNALFNNDFKKMTILKNLKTFQTSYVYKYKHKTQPHLKLLNVRFENKRFRPLTSFQAGPFNNLDMNPKNSLSFLKQELPFCSKKGVAQRDKIGEANWDQTSYYHRLPIWLFKNSFFPKHKINIDIDKVILFNSFYHSKRKQKNIFTPPRLRTNLLSLPITFIQAPPVNFLQYPLKPNKLNGLQPWGNPQNLSNKTNLMPLRDPFKKTSSNKVHPKVSLNNPAGADIISNSPLFKHRLLLSSSLFGFNTWLRKEDQIGQSDGGIPKNYLIESDSTKRFGKKLKFPGGAFVSEISKNYLAWSKKKLGLFLPFGFNDLGKIAIEKKKISRLSANSNKQIINFGGSILKNTSLNTDRSMLKNIPIHKKYQASLDVSLQAKLWHETQEVITSDLFLSKRKGESDQNNSVQITETEIIKRTALLKFLQILDGFHTTTTRKQSIFFPYLNLFGLRTQTNDMFMPLRDSLKKRQWPENLKYRYFKLRVAQRPKKIKTKPSKLRTNHKHSLSIKNFLVPLLLRKKPENNTSLGVGNTRIMNLIQNYGKLPGGAFPKINKASPVGFLKSPLFQKKGRAAAQNETKQWGNPQFKKQRFAWREKVSRRGPLKYSINSTIIFSKNDSLGYVLQKKTRGATPFENFSFVNKIPKWELYLKNQPNLKRLNLLCVWPSYIEDILGPLNLNDGASYILPEYFQLLGHGPKLKKQGITLIASTNNLTTLDAALLRPGRFDTIINFSYSFSSIYGLSELQKHSPSLGYTSSMELDQYSMAKEKNLLFLLEKNTDFLFNNTILIPSFFLIKGSRSNIFKSKGRAAAKNKFGDSSIASANLSYKDNRRANGNLKTEPDTQVTVLDIPSQSIPIKTFIDVSIFIQYKLWWSFNNEKLSWLRLYEKGLIQKTIRVSNFEKFKIFKPLSLYSVGIILKSKTVKIKNLTHAFIGILYMICFKSFYNFFQFLTTLRDPFKMKFANLKTIIDGSHTNKKFITETSINQKTNFVNTLARKILISKVVTCGLPKNLQSLNFAFDQYYVSQARPVNFLEYPLKQYFVGEIQNKLKQWKNSQKETWTLSNPTMKSFRSGFPREYNNMSLRDPFLKSNRRLMFCIGDIDYNTYSERDCDFILIKGCAAAQNGQKQWGNFKAIKNVFLKSKFSYFNQSMDVKTAFLDQSSKIWKDYGLGTAVKNVNINNAMLIKYNKIYKFKKIKLKQSFFNLHPFTSFMLKRWLEITKPNKLKRHLKIPLVNSCLSWENQIDDYLNNHDSNHHNNKNINFKVNDDSIKLDFVRRFFPDLLFSTKDKMAETIGESSNRKKRLNFSLDQKNQKNFSVIQSSWSSDFDLESLYTQIYHNLYSVTLLVPTDISLLKKKPLKTHATSSFSSINESYLFRKLSTNSCLNILCLQINPSLILSWSDPLKKKIGPYGVSSLDFSSSLHPSYLFWNKRDLEKSDKQSVVGFQHAGNQQRFTRPFPLVSLVSKETKWSQTRGESLNKKKEHNFIETPKSFFQNYKMCRLDLSFFLLIFYTMFLEKIQHKKITLNTIKILMPYRSLIFSHFLLSQSQTYDFSCKNFEILIYNKFKNFLVDL